MQRYILILFITLASTITVKAQEVLTGLSENAAVKKETPKKTFYKGQHQLELPFLDDFSNKGVFPNDSLWQDHYVFINNSYVYKPFNIGVATFDALNDTGAIHQAAASSMFPADTLTSHKIRLDSITSQNKELTPADSLYLSFYIQPQGIGNSPEPEDSLTLKFYAPQQQSWIHAWSMAGTDLQTFYDSNQVYNKRIMIPITDSIFFHEGFQMQFVNYVSLSNNNIPSWVGNVDIWNLDYVHLDMQRTYNDTSLIDWTLTSHAHSLLEHFEQMPWEQYKVNPAKEMKDTFRINYRSNRGHRKDVDMTFKIEDLSGQSSTYNTFPSPITNQKMPSFSTFEFTHFLDYNYPPNNQTYNDFELLFHIHVPDDPYNFNDTSRFYQRFYNYYAYDDGTAEAGYGLSSSSAQLAYQFPLNKPDSLQSIQMHFNRVKNNANVKAFTLTVWEHNNGEPGNIIYEETGKFPQFPGGKNRYHTYVLEEAQFVSDTFYMGWQQTTADNLNVGFDKNRNARPHIFYNTLGSWNNTIYEGALMIRPVLGNSDYAHVDVPEHKQKRKEITVYPNPANSQESIRLNTDIPGHQLICKLYSIEGRLIKQYNNSKSLNLPRLQQGIYILDIRNKTTGQQMVKKIMINP
ncbi:MAG: T9SS type A sorting domain-containing protein [Bacteroidales bacterium]|nr:T9SS type A sorting domain-containing protein [Bacteroidales bacterium]